MSSPPLSDAVAGEVAAGLARLRERIAAAEARAERGAGSVRLVGVSKRQPNERIAAAVNAGVDCLGENFAQEARDKQQAIAALLAPEVAAPAWRFIGQLQRNKAKLVAERFDACDSVDRAALASELDRRAEGFGRRLEICLQVNLSGETQKGGVTPDALPELLAHCAPLTSLQVVGLMTLPAAAPDGDPEHTRPAFAQLRELRDTLRGGPDAEHLRELSMGMSGDFEVAIEEGATLVRVGTALFGERQPRPQQEDPQ